jgi:hypothetical protein
MQKVRAGSGTLSLIFSALVMLAEVGPHLPRIVASIRGTRPTTVVHGSTVSLRTSRLNRAQSGATRATDLALVHGSAMSRRNSG